METDGEKTNWIDIYSLRLFYEVLYVPSVEYPREKDCQSISPVLKRQFLEDHLDGIFKTEKGKILQRVLCSKTSELKIAGEHRKSITEKAKKNLQSFHGQVSRKYSERKRSEKDDHHRKFWLNGDRLDIIYIALYNPRT